QVLRLGRGAAVARDEQPPAAMQDHREPLAPVVEPPDVERAQRADQRADVLACLAHARTSGTRAAPAYASRCEVMTLSIAYSAVARARPAAPRRRRSSGSASSRRTAAAIRSGRRGGTCSPVIPSATVSERPPTAEATTG